MKPGSNGAQLIAIAATGAAVAGVQMIHADFRAVLPWAIVGGAALVLAVLVRSSPIVRGVEATVSTPRRGTLAWAAVAVLLLGAVLVLTVRRQAPFLALVLWVASVVAASVAAAGRQVGPAPRERPRWSVGEIGTVVAVVAVAAVARFVWPEHVPPYIFPDEPLLGAHVKLALPGDLDTYFGIGWNAWPNLGMGVQALFVPLLGFSVHTLRLSSGVMGTLAVLATYLLARELFSRSHAVLAAVVFAACRTAIDFSRLGLCHTQVIFVQTLAFYFWWRAVHTGKGGSYLWTGASLGLCIYSYNAGHLALPLWLAWLGLCAVFAPRTVPQHARGVALAVAGLLLVTLPFAVVVTDHFTFGYVWNDWTHMARTRQVVTSLLEIWQTQGAEPAWAILKQQIWLTWLGFSVLPDNVYRIGYRDGGMLDRITAALFFLGLAYTVANAWRPRFGFLLLWWLATAVAGSVLTDGAPVIARLVGLLPALALLAAIPLWLILSEGAGRVRRTVGIAIVSLLLLAMSWDNYDTYFVRFPQREYDPMSELARYSRRLPGDAKAALLGAEHEMHYARGLFVFEFADRDFRNIGDIAHYLPYRGGSDVALGLAFGRTQTELTRYVASLYPEAEIADVIRGRDSRLVFRTATISAEALARHRGLMLRYGGSAVRADPLSPLPAGVESGEAVWSGSIHWPTHRPAVLLVTSAQPLRVDIAGTTRALDAGDSTIELELPRGWHPISIGESVAGGARRPALKVSDGGPLRVLTATDFRPDSDPGGLRAEFTRDGEVLTRTIEPLVDLFAVEEFLREEPSALKSPFRVEMQGALRVDVTGTYSIEAYSSGAFRVQLDGESVLDVPAVNPEAPVTQRAQLLLLAGASPLRIEYDGTRTAHTTRRVFQLFWTPPGGERELIPPSHLLRD